MSTATGSELRVGYVAESTIGTTPATPAFKVLETTGFNVNLTKELIEATLLGGRDRKCLRHGNRTVGGDIPSLLIYGHQDELLEAALGGTWSAAATTGSVSLSATTTSFDRTAGDFAADGFVVGQIVESSGFSEAGNNGSFIVTAVGTLSLTVTPLEGQTMTAETAASGREITADSQLKNGSVRRGFTIFRQDPALKAELMSFLNK